MTSIPYTVAAESAVLRQNIALSVIKQSAEQGQAIVKILEESSRSAPISSSRGTNVNITA